MKSTRVESKRWRYWYIAFLCMIVGGYFTATIAAKTQRSLIIGKITDAQGKEILAYKESHALLIGVSDYTKGWPDLPGVQKDIPMVKTLLEEQGFTVDVVMNPIRTALEEAFDNFINKYGQEPENRLIFYFSGHGHTLKLSYGKEMGYIVPSDAPNPNIDENGFLKKALTMKRIEEYALQIQAKHALFLFDSCFSGSLFAISRAIPEAINYKTANPVRQFITSGSENETVPDRSVFRDQFVQALRGEADRNHDGYVTGSELGEFLQTTVINYSNNAQHPQYGKIRDAALDKGDFVFRLATIATPTPAPAAAELPPTNEFNLDDLKVKDEWQTYLQKIEAAFASVQAYEQQAISTDNKIEAWKRFADFAAKDNPSSTRDDELRRLAQEQIAYWKGNVVPTPVATLLQPTQTPIVRPTPTSIPMPTSTQNQQEQELKEKSAQLQNLFDQNLITSKQFNCAYKILESGQQNRWIDGLLAGDIEPVVFSKSFKCERER